MNCYTVTQLNCLNLSFLEPLVKESQLEGFRFLSRLEQDYAVGINRFEQLGEALYGAYHQKQIIGVCGLNREPYLGAPNIGRLRHLYVGMAHRGAGVGRQLVNTVIREARQFYKLLVLRTDNAAAASFYRKLGFQSGLSVPYATHHLQLTECEYLLSLSQQLDPLGFTREAKSTPGGLTEQFGRGALP